MHQMSVMCEVFFSKYVNTRDPSSGSYIQCLAEITIMVLSCPLI